VLGRQLPSIYNQIPQGRDTGNNTSPRVRARAWGTGLQEWGQNNDDMLSKMMPEWTHKGIKSDTIVEQIMKTTCPENVHVEMTEQAWHTDPPQLDFRVLSRA